MKKAKVTVKRIFNIPTVFPPKEAHVPLWEYCILIRKVKLIDKKQTEVLWEKST